MRKLQGLLLAVLMSAFAYGAGDVVSAVEASVKQIDRAGKTITVKVADGSEHTFRIVQRTAVQGADASPRLAKASWRGLDEGSDVIVHYTKHGSEETAEEIDRIGKDGLKESKGTLSKLDRDGKKIIVKGDDGAEETYELSEHATRDAGKDIAKGSEHATRVTVYYTEKEGRKIAHFFKSAV